MKQSTFPKTITVGTAKAVSGKLKVNDIKIGDVSLWDILAFNGSTEEEWTKFLDQDIHTSTKPRGDKAFLKESNFTCKVYHVFASLQKNESMVSYISDGWSHVEYIITIPVTCKQYKLADVQPIPFEGVLATDLMTEKHKNKNNVILEA